jgi:hypothetical protein
MRKRNFLPWAGFLVAVAALVSYPLVFAQFPVTRDIPWVNWALCAVALVLAGLGVARAYRRPQVYRGRIAGPILAVLSLAVVSFFLVLTLALTRDLPPASGAPRVGSQAPDFTLPDSGGRPVRLAGLLGARTAGAPGTWVLLIFYRGYW